jgi:serine protease Do
MSCIARVSYWPLMMTGLLLSAALAVAAEPEGTRLREAIRDEHAAGADGWIYNNIAAGIQAARHENKPLFVTFRCVPCAACKAFDAEVARGNETLQQFARENFVSVRQVEMKGVDLSLFQFDHDLNWAAMFLNADGTVYARYGAQSAEGPDAYNSIAGLKATMERVLELHEEYPAGKAALAGKRAGQKEYHTALDMPGMNRKASLTELTTRENCIHCHMIHDAEHLHAQQAGTFTHDMLWRYPLPDNIGLSIDPDSGIRVQKVTGDSAAAAAGLKAGENVTHMNGQPMTSIADMQWVLHHLPNEETTLEVTGSKSGTQTLSLKAGWKESDISWRGSIWSVEPKLRVWMPPLDDAQRAEHQIPEGQGALLVKWINVGSEGGRSARDAGLREGDIVIARNGEPIESQPNQFNLYIKLNHKVGDELPLTVLRDGQPKQIRIKLVE